MHSSRETLPQNFLLESCTFADVLPIWSEHLWPGRRSAIEHYSALKREGGYNLEYAQSEVYFSRAVDATTGETRGVISGFATESQEYRLRGLFVFPAYREQGLGQKLLAEVITHAQSTQAQLIWTMPRKTNLAFYEKNGFQKISDWDTQYEFGPNCVAVRTL